ncbi:CwfJ C-terminus 1-domain-containing protein-like protein [Aspergillus caelatus]|uniref:CwfJ C-terminus 1-domain-containing protein-like protein n=2 Tax=Aspergillus subgen. Circumdati TaxID=2720871 RepID=A0A5N6ZW56_9EURO|nr:CwfJ C-terminus 1-domain-containing protein-like protein [Aspergillus caelatus]KAE8361186.1 CwfJ C-terminus 1-domain-containing protein-like protein [Aspergillus caelatus]KAE8413381.1 CwfJ C-terminus 1-domain-containing protein-like protein [Aspergillus pseudocaelatus]
MTLEDFEKSLAEDQGKRREKSDKERHRHRDRDRSRDRSRHHRHHHHRRHSSRSRERESDRHRDSRHRDEDRHRHKRSRHSTDHGDDRDHAHKRRHRHESKDDEASAAKEVAQEEPTRLKRDAWMEAPSALDIDYVHRRDTTRLEEEPKPKMLQADFELKIHGRELNQHLHDLKDGKALEEIQEEQAQHDVDYTFGDSGSQWRMTKLNAVYREAEESGKSVEEIAIERFGDLRSFDDAREEEAELDRRERYGEGYVGKEKPSGELFQERKLQEGVHRDTHEHIRNPEHELEAHGLGKPIATEPPQNTTQPLDLTALNRLKAQMMKAKLKGSPDAGELEERYNAAAAAMANRKDPGVVVLGVQQNRMLAGKRNEVKAVDTKRGRERGQVEENEDMSIEDMLREERRTRDQFGGEGKRLAERIAKDAKFENDLEYMDDNASKLARRVHQSEINLKNTTISEFQKMNRILDNCPLCHHEDTNTPPIAPVVSLATRVYLTLPTEPELNQGCATIVPIQHRTNLLECDDDEWEEIRNFMKSLTRMYHDQGRDVIFYENAAQPHRKRHAAMEVVPLPYELGETSPAFFKEAILAADSEWSQHKKLIDTLAKSKQGLGRSAFRRTLVKEMPYFHVWFELDGGLGHVVEDENRWPRGDLFAREVIGGMLDLAPDVIKRQGRWNRGGDRRVDGFKKRWRRFDWTRVLFEGQA